MRLRIPGGGRDFGSLVGDDSTIGFSKVSPSDTSKSTRVTGLSRLEPCCFVCEKSGNRDLEDVGRERDGLEGLRVGFD